MAARDYARQVDGAWVLIDGAFTIKDGGRSEVLADPDQPFGAKVVEIYDLQVPADWIGRASARDRAQFGIKPIQPADSPPDGVEVTGYVIEDFNGSPKYRAVFTPA